MMVSNRRVSTLLGALIVASAVVGVSWSVAAPPGFGSEPEDQFNAVQARLLAEVDHIVPGQPLVLGVHLHMDPGWHTYWKNGGDAGLATNIEWKLPDGFVPGEIQWPTPHRYVEAGDLVTYGYADDVLLIVEVHTPDSLPLGTPVEIEADVDWLMCKDLCIPGQAEVRLVLPVADAAALVKANVALFDAARERFPVPANAIDTPRVETFLSLNAVPPGQTAQAAIRISEVPDDAEVTWFPHAADEIWPGQVEVKRSDGTILLDAAVEVDKNAEEGMTVGWGGVVEVHAAGQASFIEVQIPVAVATPGQDIVATNADVFVGADSDTGSPSPTGTKRSIFYFLALALVGGVILNVMPCVLPVLSLKVLGFVRHADEDRGTLVKLGLAFTAGVLFSFLVLAVLVVALQQAGELLGWGFQFQNPVFVVVMIAVVFGFGLSLFGVYEIIPPVGVSGGTGRGSVYAEHFFNGILATVLATPCSAPFLGTALGFAFTQPPVTIISIFLTIGLGLALPYLLLSLNPAWLRFVPKPGAWMERFKQLMGFLLMGTAVWLLWVLSKQLGADAVIWTLAFLTMFAVALWMYGSLLTIQSSSARRLTVWIAVIALTAGSWWLFLREPLSADAQDLAANGSGGVTTTHGGLEWVDFSPERLDQVVAAGNTVFLDFTAAWCLTCKANEKTVIGSSEVVQRIRDLGVVTMVGDWTRRDPTISEMLRRYGRSGVPFYAIFPAGRVGDPIVLPEVISKGMVLEALDKAGPSGVSAVDVD